MHFIKILDRIDAAKDIVKIDKSFNIMDELKQMNIKTSLPKETGKEGNKFSYRLKQNRITTEQGKDFDNKELEKIVYTSYMLTSFIDLV